MLSTIITILAAWMAASIIAIRDQIIADGDPYLIRLLQGRN